MSGSTTLRGGTTRRRGGCLRTFVIALIALIVLLVAGDFVAKAFAESEIAAQIKSHGFPKKPSVSIAGFPFLTQVIGRDIHKVTISSKNIPEGPVDISSINAVMNGIHLNGGFSSGTVDTLAGSVLVTFPSLAHTLNSRLGPLGSLLSSSGLTLSAAGPDEVKASLNLLVASGSATWRVTRLSGQDLQVRLVNSSGVPASALSSLQTINIPIPKLPLGVKIDSVRITGQGVVGHISGRNLAFGG
ncbi:MAG: LmeA family phospholipid-binding protein [Streptosporangiaceae bacterium]